MEMNQIPEHENLLQRMRILYAEDDPETRAEMTRFLKKRAAYVLSTADGQEALAAYAQYPFDIIITDLKMPGLDGLSLIKALRDQGCRCPVVITSAFSDNETILQAVDLGIVKYCIKPLNTAELTLTLEKLACDRFLCEGNPDRFSAAASDRQLRLDYEKTIKAELAHLIKSHTGKGPREIQVSIGAGSVEICITDALTPLETTLMKNPANSSLIAYLRRILYAEARERIQDILKAITGAPIRLTDIDIDPITRQDRLTLR